MRNKKTDIAAITALAMTVATGISLITYKNTENEANGPVSFLHATVEDGIVEQTDNVYQQIDFYFDNSYVLSYASAKIDKGQTLTLSKGAALVIYDGTMSAVCGDKLINVTDGSPVSEGAQASNNNLYVVKDGGGDLYAEESSELLIKGGYEIIDNEE
ncbi:hypothetical protein IMSAG049_01615 [Clostridiales bacterium]|nr:hypothetical protein IMSAG049_01615 [Clostridiales bacterium]